jgi:hypothetical protein
MDENAVHLALSDVHQQSSTVPTQKINCVQTGVRNRGEVARASESGRAGRISSIAQSSVYFHTMAAASRAGREALKQLLDKLHAKHLRRPAA